MSYDLYFKPRSGTFTADDFAAYFANRTYFTYEGTQAFYENPDTGVYFSFDLQDESDDGDDEEQLPIALNINFFRPSYFILEAEPVVSAFVRECDLLVSDPQVDGMGDGEYQADKLVAGWNTGNRLSHPVFKEDVASGAVQHLPTARLHAAWKWNLARTQLQAEVNEAFLAEAGQCLYVTSQMFAKLDGKLVTMASWHEDVTTLLPPVDVICLGRRKRNLFGWFRKENEMLFVPWEALLPILRKYGSPRPDGSVGLSWEKKPPAEVVKFIRSLPSESRRMEVVSPDKVLDSELVETLA